MNQSSSRLAIALVVVVLLNGAAADAQAPSLGAPPLPTPTPVHSDTVCATGCDHDTLAAALAAGADELWLRDPLYTVAGLMIDRRVILRASADTRPILQAAERSAAADERLFWVQPGGQLVLQSLVLQHGRATDGAGGGLALNEGRLEAYDCEWRRGLATMGGALLNKGQARLARCWLYDNAADGATHDGLAGSGGAVLGISGSSLSMQNCTLSQNRSQVVGGGIHLQRAAKAWFSNLTVTDNESRGVGGGLAVFGEAHLEHCTVARNRAGMAGGAYVAGLLKTTAGLYADNWAGDLVLAPRSGAHEELNLLLQGANLVADGQIDGALYGAARLGELNDECGAVPVVLLLPGSAAIDRASSSDTTLQTDACGQPRFSRYLGLTGASRGEGDLGAYELQPERDGAWQALARSLHHVWIRLGGR